MDQVQIQPAHLVAGSGRLRHHRLLVSEQVCRSTKGTRESISGWCTVFGRCSTEKYGRKTSEMSARRAGKKVFDWVKLASQIPEGARAEFNAFRGRHEACRARLEY